MTARVTDRQFNQRFIDQIAIKRDALAAASNQMSSGKRVTKGSDDPVRSGTIVQLNRVVQNIDSYQERIATARGYLESEEGALNSAQTIVLRAKEIASTGANEVVSSEDRKNMATEVFQLRDALVKVANTSYRGIYVFGGADNGDEPVDQTTPYTNPATGEASLRYVFDKEAGYDVERSVTINEGVNGGEKVRINTSGPKVFENALYALDRLGRALDGYRTEPEDLSGPPTGLGAAFNFPTDYGEQTQDIQESIDLIENARSVDLAGELTSVGSRLGRMDQVNSLLDSVKVNTETARSGIENVDIFEAASNFTALQTSLQALLASSAQINNMSLMNYL